MFKSSHISAIQKVIASEKSTSKVIGLVPTMGALHEGHLSLIKAAQQKCDVVVVSIYVNPTQFTNNADLSAYPRTLEADIAKLESLKVDMLFTPTNHIMYPIEHALSINFGVLEQVMEGKFRPGHFSGVGIVVAKLFNIIQPHMAFFGQKDFQQLTIIRKMVAELMFPIKIVGVPTKRERNGLAMSSRNERLTPSQRQEAGIFFKALTRSKEILITDATADKKHVEDEVQVLFENTNAVLEYFEIVSDKDLQPKTENFLQKDTVVCVAGYLGNVRLIDNLYLIS